MLLDPKAFSMQLLLALFLLRRVRIASFPVPVIALKHTKSSEDWCLCVLAAEALFSTFTQVG